MVRHAGVVALLLCWALVAGCGSSGGSAQVEDATAGPDTDDRPVVRLGTKDFTEQYILGELYAQALRARGFRVEVKSDLGSSELVDEVLTRGGIDLYPEYTGVIVSEIAGQRRRPGSAAETYRRAKSFQARRGFEVLEMSPGFDRLANVVTAATARRHRLRAMSDLQRLGRYRYGGFPENRIRFQGALGVRQVYGLEFTFVPLRTSRQRYAALDRGDVDVVDVGTTEAQLGGRTSYRVLSDPKGVFGFQNIVPVVSRAAVREQGPAFTRTLDAVTAQLTNDALRRMNRAVDLRGRKPADVAARFLREHELL